MKTKILFLMFFVFFVSFVAAVPPVTQVQQFTEGYVIEEAQQQYLELDKDYNYHFFLYNNTNGLLISNHTTDNVVCFFAIANGDGNIIYSTNATFNLDGEFWSVMISEDILNETGYYTYGVSCQGDDYGGALASSFEVTVTGVPVSTGKYIFIASLIFILFLVSCFMMYLSTIFNEVGFKIFFLISSLIFIIATLGVGLLTINNVPAINGISEILTALISVTGAIIFIVFIWVLIRQTINALDMYNIKKGRSLGIGSGSGVGGFNTRRAY